MANKARGEVTISAGDESYPLRLSINQICELEDVTGLKFSEITPELGAPSTTLIRAIFWAALRGGGNDVTLEQAGDILADVDPTTIGDRLGEIFTAQFPAAEADENPPKAAKTGTGKAS